MNSTDPTKNHPDYSDNRFITFQNVTLRVRDRHILPATCWEIKEGQSWAVFRKSATTFFPLASGAWYCWRGQ